MGTWELGNLGTYTSGLAGSPDLAAAKQVADFFGTDHHEAIIETEELPELLDVVISATCSPDPITLIAGVGTYVAARDASINGVKVLLSGEGADELFAGYEEYLTVTLHLVNDCLIHDQLELGATECLRLDSCTMAHGIEARVPFLCSSIISRSRELPVSQKIRFNSGIVTQKYALRHAASELLPDNIVSRKKVGFPSGTGLLSVLRKKADKEIELEEVRHLRSCPKIIRYFEVQNAMGISDSLAAYTWKKWVQVFSHVTTEWSELTERGLARRFLADGSYVGRQWKMPHQKD